MVNEIIMYCTPEHNCCTLGNCYATKNIEKMIEGRLKKFLADVTLLGQNFVINPDLTVGKAAAEVGVEILGFLRFEVGEGIEKKHENFAEEVAAQLKA